MNKRFSGIEPEWTVTDDGITYKRKLYPFSKMTRFEEYSVPEKGSRNGVINIEIQGKFLGLTLAYTFYEMADAQEAIRFIKEKYGNEEIRKRDKEREEKKKEQKEKDKEREEKERIGLVYDLRGIRGRYMKVYDNRVIIGTKETLGSLVTGNVSDGEKTIYYRDCIGVQFKQSGLQFGYLQLETASAIMNQMQNNFYNENTFTFDLSVQSNEKMIEVADYVKNKVEETKNGGGQTVKNVSAADEIKKFKELLDMDIITQEEFDAKKKQLLGL